MNRKISKKLNDKNMTSLTPSLSFSIDMQKPDTKASDIKQMTEKKDDIKQPDNKQVTNKNLDMIPVKLSDDKIKQLSIDDDKVDNKLDKPVVKLNMTLVTADIKNVLTKEDLSLFTVKKHDNEICHKVVSGSVNSVIYEVTRVDKRSDNVYEVTVNVLTLPDLTIVDTVKMTIVRPVTGLSKGKHDNKIDNWNDMELDKVKSIAMRFGFGDAI